MLRNINWETGIEGLQARQPKYGIVIHAVNKTHFNIAIDQADKSATHRIEKENTLPKYCACLVGRFVWLTCLNSCKSTRQNIRILLNAQISNKAIIGTTSSSPH